MRGVREGLPRARHFATRRTLTHTRTQASRIIRGDLPIRASDLYRKGDQRRRPLRQSERRGATGLVDGGAVRVVGPRLALGRFQAKQHYRRGRPSAVSYRLRKGRGRTRVTKDLFVATMPSGYTGVFQRDRQGRRGATGRVRLVEKYGPSVAHVLERQAAGRRLIQRGVSQYYVARMEHEVNALIDREVGRG